MNRADRTILLTVLIAFLAMAGSTYEPYTFLHGDGTFYANINKSIARDASLNQKAYHPRSWLEDDLGWNRNLDQGWVNVSLGRDGRWLPKHSYVLPLFSTPFYLLLGLNGLLLFHIVMLSIIMLAAFKVAQSWLTVGGAATATLLTAAQPIVLQDVYSYNNDVFYAAMLMTGVWAYTRNRQFLAGVLMGVGVWAKATNIVFVLPFAIWLLLKRQWPTIGRAIAGFSIPILIFLGSNWYLYGSPITTSYDRILVRDNGVLVTESIRKKFDDPMVEGTKRVLFNNAQGLIPKAPVLLLTLPGILLLARRKQGAAISLAYTAAILGFVLVQAKYEYTYARFFLPVAALGVVPLGAFLEALSGDWISKIPKGLLITIISFLVAFWAIPLPPSQYRLSDHTEEAQVTNDKQRCDYFNNMHQKWECNGERSQTHFWGTSLSNECSFQGEPHKMLFLHPPVRGRQKTMTFNDVPQGSGLLVRYGLADTSRRTNVKFKVDINDQKVSLPPITKKSVILEHQLNGVVGQRANKITITVTAPPNHWRHLCFDALVVN